MTLSSLFIRGTAALVIIASAQTATAAVTYTEDRRSTSYAGTYGSGSSAPPGLFADWSSWGQTSSLRSSSFSATGQGDAYSDYDWSQSASLFDITFTIATDHRLHITGKVWGNDEQWGEGNASFYIYRGDDKVENLGGRSVHASGGYEEASLNGVALLHAGEYRLVARANPYTMIATSGFEVNGTFVDLGTVANPSPVPVPAAGWLFGSALLGLAAKRRSK